MRSLAFLFSILLATIPDLKLTVESVLDILARRVIFCHFLSLPTPNQSQPTSTHHIVTYLHTQHFLLFFRCLRIKPFQFIAAAQYQQEKLSSLRFKQ